MDLNPYERKIKLVSRLSSAKSFKIIVKKLEKWMKTDSKDIYDLENRNVSPIIEQIYEEIFVAVNITQLSFVSE